jgi:hypothetical protein
MPAVFFGGITILMSELPLRLSLLPRSRIVRSVCREPRDAAFDLLEQRDRDTRIIRNSVGERRIDDEAVLINAQVQLAPTATLVRSLVLVRLPLAVAQYLQAGGVDDEVKRASASSKARNLNIREATKPSAWRKGRWKTVLKVNAVTIARSEYVRGPPGRPLDGAFHALVASSSNQTVMSPRSLRAVS